jgi:hypothetical protein
MKLISESNEKIVSAIIFGTVVFGMLLTHFLTSNAQRADGLYVRITTPDENEHVPTGNLTIYGRSSDDATTPCHVLVTLNDKWPLDPATPTGSGGKDDYSTWTYTYTPYFGLIKEGSNKLESSIRCQQNGANSTAWHALNVTGEPEELPFTKDLFFGNKTQK